MMSIDFQESISEVLDILNNMDEIYINAIPKKFINFLYANRSKTYVPKLDHSKKLKEMNLKKETKNILYVIYTKYWRNNKKLVMDGDE